jgi:hypothetical protein
MDSAFVTRPVASIVTLTSTVPPTRAARSAFAYSGTPPASRRGAVGRGAAALLVAVLAGAETLGADGAGNCVWEAAATFASGVASGVVEFGRRASAAEDCSGTRATSGGLAVVELVGTDRADCISDSVAIVADAGF